MPCATADPQVADGRERLCLDEAGAAARVIRRSVRRTSGSNARYRSTPAPIAPAQMICSCP